MNKNIWQFDLKLLIPIFVVVVLSLTTLFSINAELFKSQLIYLLISIFAFIIFSQSNLNVLKNYSLPIFIFSVVVLTALLVVGIESRGSTRWFELFGFRIQFSEILKPFLAISLSSFLINKNNRTLKNLIKGMLFLFPIAFLIFLQPDLGNALIYSGVAVLTFIYFGFPLRFFLGGFLSAIALIPVFWQFMHNYQRQRILTFLNPAKDPLGTSYNTIQAVITVGSGMIFGKGLGQGTQSSLHFLPERHTDFIFATISEDFGFIGALVIVIAYGFFFHRLIQLSLNTTDDFTKIFTAVAFFL
ncbi:FtsW/RodA/SpoVE family cell cycle protein, partial [Patescibacteria group bacterium]|nr:FtsW/RodA/SpoVE family cell cycle protein [Patescibacteria group bacterium]